MQIVEYKTISMRITDAFGRVDKNGIDDERAGIHNQIRFDYVINNNIKKNWQPLGQPFVILDKRWQQINQTMVKYAEPSEIESILSFHDRLKEIPDDIGE